MLITIVVEQGSNHVVRLRDGMEIAREVEVDLVHWQHLGIAATSSATLHAEARTEGWLTQSDNSLLAYLLHTECQTYTHGSLAIASLGRTDGCDQDEVMTGKLRLVDGTRFHLGDVTTIILDLLLLQAQLLSDLVDRA